MNIITKNIGLARLLKQSLAVLLFCEMSSRNLSVSLLSWMSLMYDMSSSSIPILRGLTFSGKNLLKRHQQMSIKKSFDVNQKFVKLLIECHRCVFQPLFFSNTVNIDDYSAGLISVKGVYIQIEPSCWAWPVFSGQSCIKTQIFRCFGGMGVFHGRNGCLPAVILTGVSPLQTISPAEFLCTALIFGFVGFFVPPYLSIWTSFKSDDFSKPFFKQGTVLPLSTPISPFYTLHHNKSKWGCVCFCPFTKDLLQLKLWEAAFTRPVEHWQITPFDFSLLH